MQFRLGGLQKLKRGQRAKENRNNQKIKYLIFIKLRIEYEIFNERKKQQSYKFQTMDELAKIEKK